MGKNFGHSYKSCKKCNAPITKRIYDKKTKKTKRNINILCPKCSGDGNG